MEDKLKTKCRRFRFSLQTLLLLVAIASIAFGWLGYKVREAQRRAAAVKSLRELGAEVLYDYEFDSDRTQIDSPMPPGATWLRNLLGIDFLADVTEVSCSSTRFTDAELVRLQHFTRLERLKLFLPTVTDRGLASIRGLTNLTWLTIENSEITDAGLIHLRQLSKLDFLDLNGAMITDAGLVHLQGLTQLKSLWLNGTQITDAGLTHLQGHTQLEYLELDSTLITDNGLIYLKKFTQLGILHVGDTKITESGLQQLADALPNTAVISWAPPYHRFTVPAGGSGGFF